MKKVTTLFLTVAMIISVSLPVAAATTETDADTATLNSIADSSIQVTTSFSESGASLTTYQNIQTFIDTVHSTLPDTSDYDLAKFLFQYIGQSSDNIPEDSLLDILTYKSISSSTSFIAVDSDGTSSIYEDAMPLDVWTSSDGYMRISTNFGQTKVVNGETYYEVWATATWIKYPSVCLQDAFAIGTTGTFDDSVAERGTVFQTFQCKICNKYTYWNRFVSKDSTVDDDLSLGYETFVPVLHFKPTTARCEHCGGHDADDIRFDVFLKYGIIANRSVNIQSGYAHNTLGTSDITVSIGTDGVPNFSVGTLTKVVPYIARAVTVK